MGRFTVPRDIYSGENAMETVGKLGIKKAFVVTGGHAMKKYGFLDKILGYLEDSGAECRVFDGVEPDPSVETVMRGAEEMRSFSPDWIVALGGGSPIDAAKAMWAFYEYPETTFESLCIPFNFPTLRTKARFCAVSSTSGTATEVTAFSVITDYEHGIKYPLADFNITPDVAVVDPALAMTMPKKLAAHTGMDALTHAIEAYVSTAASNFTDPLALKAIEMVVAYLPSSYNGNCESRAAMHDAQCLAGMAFSNSLLGITHSMAHKTGAVFRSGHMSDRHVPHGCANAIYLPYVIRYNSHDGRALSRYAEISRMLGLSGGSERALTENLCNLIISLNRSMDIPLTLQDFGVDKDEFDQKIDKISANAVKDACTLSNPRSIDAHSMKKLFICTYYGAEVDF